MNILKAYKTSRGIFLDEAEASKKANRSKECGSRPGEHEDKFFELNEVSVK